MEISLDYLCKKGNVYIIIIYILIKIIVTFDRKIIKENLPCKLLCASVGLKKVFYEIQSIESMEKVANIFKLLKKTS